MAPIKSLAARKVQDTLALTAKDKEFFPSPEAWEDEVLYFLLPDRFSNNTERDYRDIHNNVVTTGTTPMYRPEDKDNALSDEKSWVKWMTAGSDFAGGNLRGITSKLGYLKRLGVTAIWLAPFLKQVKDAPSYHGYAVQNFLEVDPRFGTRKDLRTLVKLAHRQGIRIILDVLINHCGDVFAYKQEAPRYDNGKKHEVKGFWNANRSKTDFIPMGVVDEKKYPKAYPEGAVWPAELQAEENFGREGEIVDWETSPEYRDGDFFKLKKFDLGCTQVQTEEEFEPSVALETMVDIWKFWIAYADLDGFRIDAGKHLGKGPLRHFVSEIRAFTRTLGKDNFLMVGEIAGPEAIDIVRSTGLDGALGIGDPQQGLWSVPQGLGCPEEFFKQFSNHANSEGWYRNEVITLLDDHDQIWKNGLKARFGSTPHAMQLLPAALGMSLCTAGIPCVYYGTEQSFDGASEPPPLPADAYIREAMFGGGFGPFRSHDRHFFDENAPGYRIVQDLSRLRAKEPIIRRGAQYMRQVSRDGINFDYPRMTLPAWHNTMEENPQGELGPPLRSLVGWSRILNDQEVLCVINTDPANFQESWVLLDASIHKAGDTLNCLYPPRGQPAKTELRGPIMAVHLRLAPGAFCVYKKRGGWSFSDLSIFS